MDSISGDVWYINLISLPLIHISQRLPSAAGFHPRKGRRAEESREADCIGLKPVLTLIRYSGLDNEASTSVPAADVACPQSILGKRSSHIQGKAVRSRVKSKVEGAEKQSWLWAPTLGACS